MERLNPDLDYQWHSAINKWHKSNPSFYRWMYEAKSAADELPRLISLFEMERNGKLAKTHYQCSHDLDGQPVPDNHLTCVFGTECRNCGFLLALEKANVTPDQLDYIKAWTCLTHILSQGEGIDTSEGFILTTDDQIYWQNVYASLAAADEDDEPIDDEDGF